MLLFVRKELLPCTLQCRLNHAKPSAAETKEHDACNYCNLPLNRQNIGHAARKVLKRVFILMVPWNDEQRFLSNGFRHSNKCPFQVRAEIGNVSSAYHDVSALRFPMQFTDFRFAVVQVHKGKDGKGTHA